MNIEQAVLENLRSPPPRKQQEVLDFVDSLGRKDEKPPRRSLKGLWADLSTDITEEDISEIRREMWR
jgi:hypothetical protein